MWEEPSLSDIFAARQVVSRYLPRTPFLHSAALSGRLCCEVYIKYENMQPIGAFKVRGGIYLLSRLSAEERQRGVITASTGNHGQSIAYAARAFGVKACIAAPVGANPYKVTAMEALGAEVALHGRDFDEARLWAESKATEEGWRYIHPANEPLLIAGVATLSLEVIEDLPDADVILAPIGGGSGACGHCLAAKRIRPQLQVIGVQAENAPAICRSWKSGQLLSTGSADTFAEGLATRYAFEFTLGILRRYLDDFILVSEAEMEEAILALLETTHQLAEGAGAAATAAAFQIKERLLGKKVVLILSGGNLTLEKLAEIMGRRRP
ncbi:MAG: threonine/serine dehydratase [Armatimonadetes bacterium]|nr:threonine/serine dehydratase [Armatimonadota bacterium]